MTCGIYTILNKIDCKIYVGYCRNFINRKRIHICELLRNKHHNSYLQNAVNKYGIENFEIEILEECDKEFLCSQEHYWCNILNSHNSNYGYNIRPTHPYEIYKSNSIESNRKTGEKNKIALKGKRHSEYTKNKMSLSAKNNKFVKESIEKRKISVIISYDSFSKEFNSISDLCREYSFNNNMIGKAIKENNIYRNKYKITINKNRF